MRSSSEAEVAGVMASRQSFAATLEQLIANAARRCRAGKMLDGEQCNSSPVQKRCDYALSLLVLCAIFGSVDVDGWAR